MLDENGHAEQVDAWSRRAAQGLGSDQLLAHFQQAFRALWGRASVTLGAVTLTAITERVLYSAAERYPALAQLQVDDAGINCRELRATAPALPRAELEQGLRFVLVEFLTVLGNLTAEILSPALHAELSKLGLDDVGGERTP